MPYFTLGGDGSGGGTWEPPALIGTGPPAPDPTAHGKIYVDSLTNQTYVNIDGQWVVTGGGGTGRDGQPRFTGVGVPDESSMVDPQIDDLYLDTASGLLYKKVS